MSPYQAYPNINAMPYAERLFWLKKSCLIWLGEGNPVAELQGSLVEVLAKEQYEMAEAMRQAIEEFTHNPQLALL